jgi:protein translocase SecG subunit
MVQKGKSSMGLGTLGGGTQLLFGGSGGQDLFQKITWVLGALFMISSLTLALMKSTQRQTFQYVKTNYTAPAIPQQSTPENSSPVQANSAQE